MTINSHNLHEEWFKVVSRRINGAQGIQNIIVFVKNRFFRDLDADFKALGTLCNSNILYNVSSTTPNSHVLHGGWFKKGFQTHL